MPRTLLMRTAHHLGNLNSLAFSEAFLRQEAMSFQLMQGDSAEVLRTLPDGCIDLTVTSPPYDNLRTYNGYSFDFEAIAKELYRVTKQGGVVVWVVGDATVKGGETGTSFRQALFFKECGFNLHDTMIYRKMSGPNAGSVKAYRASFEYMFVFSKGSIKTTNLIKDYPNKSAGRKTFGTKRKAGGHTEKYYFEVPDFSIRPNVWDIDAGYMRSTTDKEAFEHPAIFPESLAHDHIISWSNEGDTVLDPFLGSGTTGKMAIQTGRNFIGIEISEEYLAIAKSRIESASLAKAA
jgi:DNA modification methylase